MTLTIGSLFSGIGGLELGLEWAGLGPVAWQVEINPQARSVLEQHWPEATRHDDVRSVGSATLSPVDLICGGFPCQDVSSAGKRAGLDGARSGLWFEFHRVVSELLPQWVVVENVASGANRWVDAVVEGLEQLGYACLPIPLAAADVGAPHLRARVFIVAAHAHSNGQSEAASANPDRELRAARNGDAREERSGRAVVAGGCAEASPNTLRARCEGARGRQLQQRQSSANRWRTPEPDMVRMVSRIPRRLDGAHARARIEALGNSVVPQCAEVIGWVIRELSAAQEAA